MQIAAIVEGDAAAGIVCGQCQCFRADAALLEYREAVSRDPKCLLPEKETIEVLLRASHFEQVMERSMKLLEIAPMDSDAKLSLAKALRAQAGPDAEVYNGPRNLDSVLSYTWEQK